MHSKAKAKFGPRGHIFQVHINIVPPMGPNRKKKFSSNFSISIRSKVHMQYNEAAVRPMDTLRNFVEWLIRRATESEFKKKKTHTQIFHTCVNLLFLLGTRLSFACIARALVLRCVWLPIHKADEIVWQRSNYHYYTRVLFQYTLNADFVVRVFCVHVHLYAIIETAKPPHRRCQ